jgi:hypothetical protein
MMLIRDSSAEAISEMPGKPETAAAAVGVNERKFRRVVRQAGSFIAGS